MDVYRGIVRNNVVVLDKDVQLADGLTVEVRVPTMESAVSEALRARGLLLAPAATTPSAMQPDRRPVVVKGRPLSEQIVAERR